MVEYLEECIGSGKSNYITMVDFLKRINLSADAPVLVGSFPINMVWRFSMKSLQESPLAFEKFRRILKKVGEEAGKGCKSSRGGFHRYKKEAIYKTPTFLAKICDFYIVCVIRRFSFITAYTENIWGVKE